MKVLSQVYFDQEDTIKFDRKGFITYLYTIFSNDHMAEDFQFGAELLQEYIESNFSEFSTFYPNATSNTSGNNGKKKKKSKQEQH